jgi:hypothetical protein
MDIESSVIMSSGKLYTIGVRGSNGLSGTFVAGIGKIRGIVGEPGKWLIKAPPNPVGHVLQFVEHPALDVAMMENGGDSLGIVHSADLPFVCATHLFRFSLKEHAAKHGEKTASQIKDVLKRIIENPKVIKPAYEKAFGMDHLSGYWTNKTPSNTTRAYCPGLNEEETTPITHQEMVDALIVGIGSDRNKIIMIHKVLAPDFAMRCSKSFGILVSSIMGDLMVGARELVAPIRSSADAMVRMGAANDAITEMTGMASSSTITNLGSTKSGVANLLSERKETTSEYPNVARMENMMKMLAKVVDTNTELVEKVDVLVESNGQLRICMNRLVGENDQLQIRVEEVKVENVQLRADVDIITESAPMPVAIRDGTIAPDTSLCSMSVVDRSSVYGMLSVVAAKMWEDKYIAEGPIEFLRENADDLFDIESDDIRREIQNKLSTSDKTYISSTVERFICLIKTLLKIRSGCQCGCARRTQRCMTIEIVESFIAEASVLIG